jgi:hypothetical protein
MSGQRFVRFAGWAGVAAFVLFVSGLVAQGAAGPLPSFTDTAAITSYLRNHESLLISAGLLISLALMIELVLVVGVRELIRDAGGPWVSAGDVFLFFYVVAYPIGLVASGLLIAATTEAVTKGDASAVRALWGGGYSLLGAVTYLPLMLASATYAIAVRRTGALPQWTAWVGWIAALGAAAAVPAAFGGTGVYSQLGAAPGLIQGVPGLAWLLVVSIGVLRAPAVRSARPASA